MLPGGRALAAALVALVLMGAAETPPDVPDLGPVDHRGTTCPGAPARHRVGRAERHPDGVFRVTVRSSMPARKDREIRLRPGRVLHLEVELQNVGTKTRVLAPADLEMLRRVAVRSGAGTGVPLHEGRGAYGPRPQPDERAVRPALTLDEA